MSTFRIGAPRSILALALEGGMIYVVLQALASVTTLAMSSSGEMDVPVAAASGLFLLCVCGTRQGRFTDDASLRREVALVTAVSAAIGILSFASLLILFGTTIRPAALLMLEGAVAVPATVAAWRWVTVRYGVLDGYRERVLIVGAGETARSVARWIGERHGRNFAVVGFADDSQSRIGQVLAMGACILTDFASLPSFCSGRVDRVIVALDEKRGKLPIEQLVRLRLTGIEIEESVTFFERISGKIAVETLLPSWLIFSNGFKVSRMRRATKRVADVVLSIALLVVALPFMLLTALAIRIEGRGPILYRQRRVGLDGREFEILKFRSMIPDAEVESGPMWAGKNDPRVTRVGRFIRLTRLDELPQLINVLRGEMSFVGPRPERPVFVERLRSELPFYSLRHATRPGLTGWAQVEYQYGATVEDAREKLKYDLFYIKNANPVFDLWIVLKTVRVVLFAHGAR